MRGRAASYRGSPGKARLPVSPQSVGLGDHSPAALSPGPKGFLGRTRAGDTTTRSNGRADAEPKTAKNNREADGEASGCWGWPARRDHVGGDGHPPPVTPGLPSPEPPRLREAVLTTRQTLLKAPNILPRSHEDIIPIGAPSSNGEQFFRERGILRTESAKLALMF